MIDISTDENFLARSLSNFTLFNFEFDGIKCTCMEGLLQSFKFCNRQAEVCIMTGYKAKRIGSAGKDQPEYWTNSQTLYWNDNKYKRDSEDYYDLILRAYVELYKQNKFFRYVLNSTRDQELKHSIGKKNKNETVLTEDEMCSILTIIREGMY